MAAFRKLYEQTEDCNKTLLKADCLPKIHKRLKTWLDGKFRSELIARSDSEGFARQDKWY